MFFHHYITVNYNSENHQTSETHSDLCFENIINDLAVYYPNLMKSVENGLRISRYPRDMKTIFNTFKIRDEH